MTLDEFFEELKRCNVKWKFDSVNKIRCEKGNCPITAVVKYKKNYTYDVSQWDSTTNDIDLSLDLGGEIVDSADENPNLDHLDSIKHDPDGEDSHIRARIEDACSLGMVNWL